MASRGKNCHKAEGHLPRKAIVAWFILSHLVLMTACATDASIKVTNKTSRLKDKLAQEQRNKPLVMMKLKVKTEKPDNTGSLWNKNQSRNYFFLDAKASHVGDIVTVRVVENAKGSKAADTSTSRSSSLEASTASFLGLPTSTVNKLRGGTAFSNSFEGDGTTSRSGSLTADVTAIVTAVYENGNMLIEGNREVLINSEKEILSVSGIIRPEDVARGNTVLSTVIAEARIEYTGSGVVSDKQKPGWLMRIVDFIWPF